jgi:hypothetical protein
MRAQARYRLIPGLAAVLAVAITAIAACQLLPAGLLWCGSASEDQVSGTYLEPFQWTIGVEILKLRADQTFEERFVYFDGDAAERYGTVVYSAC